MTAYEKAMVTLAGRIADALEALAYQNAPEQEPEPPPTCPHPVENRIDFGMTNGRPDWECSLCQYRAT